MDKAARAVRRSSVKLLSLNGGHADLNVLISEVKDMRNTAKAFMNAQSAASQDLLKWTAHEDNRAIQDVANQLAELNLVWTEVQREFIEHIKEYKHMYEMVLEGEKHVAHAKTNFASCEQREVKIRKELKKAFKKATSAELQSLEGRLSQAERAKDLAQVEVADRVHENEAVKLIRIKEGLLKVSDAYCDFSKKCSVIFDAQSQIAHQLPDVHGQDLGDIKYTGSGTTKFYVQEAKEKIRQCRRQSHNFHSPQQQNYADPPPPYSPNDLIESEQSPYSPSRTSEEGVSPRRRSNLSWQGRQDTMEEEVGVDSDYEADLTGAMGGAQI
ncbi:uncharacterized protein LOC124112918 isoform X1 [Haliotis rufescens]|uniref:uncharacterized protein LOC124112918 isoform X1 n=1 Tax=Haliotis rufescens TaxID=6454 RepID=UPI001EB01D7A|nr:uncharacterized protein LOC124112918 isoform X1 [Haliotis rufescens]